MKEGKLDKVNPPSPYLDFYKVSRRGMDPQIPGSTSVFYYELNFLSA